VAAKQKEISELEHRLGLGDRLNVENEISLLTTQRFALTQDRNRFVAEQNTLQDEIDRIQEFLNNPDTIEIPPAEVNEQLRNAPGLTQFYEQLFKLDSEIEKTRQKTNPDYFETAVRGLRADRKAVDTQLQAAILLLKPALEAQIRETKKTALKVKLVEQQRTLDRARKNVITTQAQITAIEQRLTQLRGGNNPQEKVKHLAALADLNSLEKNRDDLEDRHRRAKQDAQTVSRVSVVEPAQVPRERTNDRKIKYGSAAAIGAFALAFLCVALLDFRLRRVNSVQDITQGLGLPVVGTLPLVPNRDARQLLKLDDTEANPEQLALREAVDGVRTVVLHAGRQQPLQVLLVSSPLTGEGKTTLASQLATSLARSGRRTLLLDCDLRSPSCAELFNRPGVPGVCEVLRGDVPVEDAIQTTEQALLFLIPAGKCDNKALQALSQDLPKNLFDILREHFEYIVVDSGPILPVSDTLQIATHTDAVLIAILEQASQLPAVHHAQQKLATLGIRVLGAVVGGTQQQVYLYGSRNRANQKAKEG
jgi:capsular exopolysaccharide synthesis family protein